MKIQSRFGITFFISLYFVGAWVLPVGAEQDPQGARAQTQLPLQLRTLTTLNVLDPSLKQKEIPTGSEVKLIQELPEGRMEFRYQNESYFLDRFLFVNSVETVHESETRSESRSGGGSESEIGLESELLAEILEGGRATDPTQCPLDEKGQLKSGQKWNFATARLVVEFCPVIPVTVVKRTWNAPWNPNCRPQIHDLSQVNQWVSCAPPPNCSAEQAAAKRAAGQERLAAWKLRCAGKRVTIPPDRDPRCSSPVGVPHTIVIHQTEGNMTDGPDTLQKFHLNKGWDDIGYHYVLAKTSSGWRAFEGRMDGVEGSHAGAGLNRDTIGISVAGNFLPSANRGKPSDQILPPPQAILLLKGLAMKVKSQYPTIKFIYGHGEFKRKGMGCDTDCPSPALQQFVNRMRTVYFP